MRQKMFLKCGDSIDLLASHVPRFTAAVVIVSDNSPNTPSGIQKVGDVVVAHCSKHFTCAVSSMPFMTRAVCYIFKK